MLFGESLGERDLLNKHKKRKNTERNSTTIVSFPHTETTVDRVLIKEPVGETSEFVLWAWKQSMVAVWVVTPLWGLPRQPSLITWTVKNPLLLSKWWHLSPAAVLDCVLVCSDQATYCNLFWQAWASNIYCTDAASCSATGTGELPWLHLVITQPVWSVHHEPHV